MDIDQTQEIDYETVSIDYVGYVDPHGMEGMIVLKSGNGKEFHMRAFSGEVARNIASFGEAENKQAPSVYKMISEICEENELALVKVKIYDNGQALRANLYFTGRKDLFIKNQRASDAMALASYYDIPLLIRKNLLVESMGA